MRPEGRWALSTQQERGGNTEVAVSTQEKIHGAVWERPRLSPHKVSLTTMGSIQTRRRFDPARLHHSCFVYGGATASIDGQSSCETTSSRLLDGVIRRQRKTISAKNKVVEMPLRYNAPTQYAFAA